jgi:serine/threonine kinase 38
MEAARRWFRKRWLKKKEAASPSNDLQCLALDVVNEEPPSNETKLKVEAAKHFVERYYKNQKQIQQERIER